MSVSVEINNVSVNYNGVSILENISANIPGGSLTAVLGPNGGGKTTLLKCLLNSIKYSGKIVYKSLKQEKIKIGYVPQKVETDRNIPVTVLEYLVSGFQTLPVVFGVFSKHKKEAEEALNMTGGLKLINKQLGKLSGGEMQRVLLALALMQKPNMLVLDEPSSGIDMSGEALFCGLISSLKKRLDITVIMVTHDIEVARAHSDNILLLKKTVRGSGSPSEMLKDQKLKELFGFHHKADDNCRG